MPTNPLTLSLSELLSLPTQERERLSAIEDSIQDRLLAGLDAMRRDGVNTDFMQRALVPILLSLAARTYSEVVDGLDGNPSQFLTLARESLAWANDRSTAAPAAKH
jgi:hypothetical protein